MRVVSWNVNGIRACVRRGFVDFLDRSGADILGVQEVRALPEEIPLAARTPTDWHAVFAVAERRGYSGVGIYSKFQPVLVETSLGEPRFDIEGRFIAAHFRTDRGRVAVVNGYFPKGSGKDRDNSRVGYKLDFYQAVFDRARRCCTARSKSLTSLCRLQSHPAQYVSGIPSAAILLSISHPIRCSTRCLANVRARISGPMIAL